MGVGLGVVGVGVTEEGAGFNDVVPRKGATNARRQALSPSRSTREH